MWVYCHPPTNCTFAISKTTKPILLDSLQKSLGESSYIGLVVFENAGSLAPTHQLYIRNF
jgi:hypothetical protein